MAEYVLKQDDDQGEVARMLLEHAGDRAGEVEWRPRPNRAHGGVFYVPDDLAEGLESDRLNRADEGEADQQKQADQEAGQQPRQSRAAARRAARESQNKE